MICDDLGIVQFDMDGRIIDCNENFLKLVGAEKETAIGFGLLTSVIDKEVWWAVLSALSGKHGCYTGDHVSVLGNRILKLKATFATIKSLSGKPIGGLGIFEELDQSKNES